MTDQINDHVSATTELTPLLLTCANPEAMEWLLEDWRRAHRTLGDRIRELSAARARRLTEQGISPDIRQVLRTPMGVNDAGADTIQDYLISLLAAIWEEGEGFSGKRPFGNSYWEYDVYDALVKAGHIVGTVAEDGEVDDVDRDGGYALIRQAIEALRRWPTVDR